MNIQGFLPIIVDVSPVSIPLLLGSNSGDDPLKPASQNSPREKFNYAQPADRFSQKNFSRAIFLR